MENKSEIRQYKNIQCGVAYTQKMPNNGTRTSIRTFQLSALKLQNRRYGTAVLQFQRILEVFLK